MSIQLSKDICNDLEQSEEREWLVTNGLGGFACGTVAGLLTRRYHGVLVAALHPPLGRTLLVSKYDESATYGGYGFPLFTNRWSGAYMDPKGYTFMDEFRLEDGLPVWTYRLGDALLEKRLW